MKRCVVLAFSLFCSTMPAIAANAIPYKQVNGWDVLMDPTMGNACYVTTTYDGGVTLRLGFDFTGPKGMIYIALGNNAWKSIEDGKDYPVEIQFDNQPVWKANAKGTDFADSKWLHIITSDPNFAEEFSRKLGMRVRFNGQQIAGLRLKGTSRAMDEMLACQAMTNEALGSRGGNKPAPPPPSDPFSSGQSVKSANDPFDL